MVLRRLLCPGLALLALVGARPAGAAAITFTGNVTDDYGGQKGVFNVPGLSNPLNIGQSQAITNAGDISGWAIKDIALSYDKTTDTMYVGVQTFTNSHGVKSIAGDAYGSGTQGGTDNPPNFGVNTPGSDKSITVAFAPDSPGNATHPGTPTVVAGVPANKAANGSGIDGFTVSNYAASSAIQTSFGSPLINNVGALAFNPNAAHPDFEFTISNFSHLPGIDVAKGFWVAAYAGSLKDVAVGETYIDFTRVIVPQPQVIPEPATVLAWSVLVGAVACGRIRRKATARVGDGK